MPRAFATLLALLLSASACGRDAARHAPAGPAAPKPPALAPAYRVSIQLDPATAGLLGKKLSATILALRALEDRPGQAILQLAVFQGLPGAEWIGRLPRPLRSKLADWLDEALLQKRADGSTPVARAGEVIRQLQTFTQVIVLDTVLETTGSAGQHRVRGLRLSAAGRDLTVPLPSDVVGIVPAGAPALTLDGAALALGPHRFSVPIGAMLLEAHRELVLRPAGFEDLAGLLEHAVGCPEVAASLAGHCVLGQCISSLASVETLTGLCRAGLAAAARQLEDDLRGEQLTVLDLQKGSARLAGEGAAAPRLEDGRFTVTITAEGETATGEAPFTGELL